VARYRIYLTGVRFGAALVNAIGAFSSCGIVETVFSRYWINPADLVAAMDRF